RERLELVRVPVAVGVAQARELAALNGVDPAVVDEQPERLLQALEPLREADALAVCRVRVAEQPDLAAAAAHGRLAVGEERDAADLEDHVLRRLDADHGIEVGLGGRLQREEELDHHEYSTSRPSFAGMRSSSPSGPCTTKAVPGARRCSSRAAV